MINLTLEQFYDMFIAKRGKRWATPEFLEDARDQIIAAAQAGEFEISEWDMSRFERYIQETRVRFASDEALAAGIPNCGHCTYCGYDWQSERQISSCPRCGAGVGVVEVHNDTDRVASGDRRNIKVGNSYTAARLNSEYKARR